MLLLLFACEPDVVTDEVTDTAPGDDSGGVSTLPDVSDITATVSEIIPTVVTVSWSGSPGTVRFGVGEQERGVATSAVVGDRNEAVLVGLPPETDAFIEVSIGEEMVASATVTTGPVDSQLPVPEIVTGLGEGYYLTAIEGGSEYYPVIFDWEGNPVWWHIYEGEREWYTSRLWLSADGTRFVYNAYHIHPEEPDSFAGLISVKLDGTEEQLTSLPNGHHDFWLHDDGTVAYPRYDRREKFDETVIGDELVVLQPDGSEQVLWSAWDALTLTKGDLTENPEGTFWTMANAVEYSADDDSYVMGLRNRNALVSVSAAGAEQWMLGGADSDFDVEARFAGAHGFELSGNEVLIFDNNSDDRDTSQLLRMSMEGGEAPLLWQYNPTPLMYTAYFGDVLTYPDRIASTWGTGGTLRVTDTDGNETFSLTYDPPRSIGFLRWEETLTR